MSIFRSPCDRLGISMSTVLCCNTAVGSIPIPTLSPAWIQKLTSSSTLGPSYQILLSNIGMCAELETHWRVPRREFLHIKRTAGRPVCRRNSAIFGFRFLLDDHILLNTFQTSHPRLMYEGRWTLTRAYLFPLTADTK